MVISHKNLLQEVMRKAAFLVTGLVMIIGMSACTDNSASVTTTKDSTESTEKVTPTVVLKVGYDNVKGDPFDLGMRRWKEELELRSGGRMTLELYPESTLDTKENLLKRIQGGEVIATMADGANLYGLGAYDLGIFFGPYIFKNWDEAVRLTKSKWCIAQMDKLAKDHNIRVISSEWEYGVRHLMSTRPITKFSEIDGLRIRTSLNDIQSTTWANFGAEAKKMPLSAAYNALRNKEVDAIELPISMLYAGNYHKVAPYLLLSGHVHALANIIVPESFWNTLSEGDQLLFQQSCDRAADFFNVVQQAYEYSSIKKLVSEGVTVTTPSPKMFRDLSASARSFYTRREISKNWTPGLYYKTLGAKAIPWTYYTSKGIDPETHRLIKD